MTNILTRLGLQITHFSDWEVKAQAKAYTITSQIKALLESNTALTLEAIIPNGVAYGQAVDAIITKFIPILKTDVVAKDADFVAGLLGRLGAQLTAEIHGNVHPTMNDYVLIFESLKKLKQQNG